MAYTDGPESVRDMRLWDYFILWIARPFPCQFVHAWSRWESQPCQGFNIAFQLVAGIMFSRRCRRCGKYESHAQVAR
jgi:hypothetical protein